jgi:hypothetical protein
MGNQRILDYGTPGLPPARQRRPVWHAALFAGPACLLGSFLSRDIRLLFMALVLTIVGLWGSLALMKRWSPRTTYYVIGLVVNVLCLILLITIFASFRLEVVH